MTNHLHIALSGSALVFAAGMIVKYGKIFCAKDSDDGSNCDRVLLYGDGDRSQGEVCRRWDVEHIAHYLRKSKRTIDVCLTRLTNAELAAALIDIKKNNIRIKVLIHGSNTEGCQARLLRKHGIEVKKMTPAQKLQHSFMLMDAESCAGAGAPAPTPTALIGALDAAEAGERDVYDSTLITTAPFVTTTLALEFQRLWAQFK